MISFLGLSGNPLGDLLQGFPTFSVGARLDNPQNLRSRSYSGFVHDTYRLGPSLVITAGLRYEYSTPVTLGEHRLMFRPRDSHDLRLLRTGLTIEPTAQVRWIHDPFGNSTRSLTALERP